MSYYLVHLKTYFFQIKKLCTVNCCVKQLLESVIKKCTFKETFKSINLTLALTPIEHHHRVVFFTL